MATVIIQDPSSGSQARVIAGVLQTTGGGGGGGGDVNLTEVGSSPISIGPSLSANSLPVVFPTDMATVPVNQAGVNPTQACVNTYGIESSVAIGTETTIVSYTAPMGKIAYLLGVSVSGQNSGQWIVYNNSDVYDQQQTSVAQMNSLFNFSTGSQIVPGQIIGTGNVISVTVNQPGYGPANFNARIQVLEIG